MTMVRDVMTKDVKVCAPHDSVTAAAQIMRDVNCGSVPVCEGKKVVGMITDRDIVVRGVAEKHPGSTKVEDIMSSKLVTISADATTKEAANLMAEHQIRRLPVVEGDKLIGIVSLGDFAISKLTDDQAKEALTEISEQNYNGVQH